MAQQVFPQWSPVVKAHNEDQQEVYIPAAIIHAQTRDGKDELIVGAANMQFDPETGDYLPTHAGNPVEVRARALETLLQTLGKEETLALVKAALDVLVSKDFATQTTLAAVLEKLADLATESTLDGVKSAVDALASTVDAGAQKVTLSGRIVELAFGGPLEVTAGSSVDIVLWDYRPDIVQIRAGLVFSSAYAGNYRLVLRESALASSAGTFRTGDILQINNGIRGTGSIEVMTPRWSVSVVNQNEFDATIYRYSIMGVVG